MQPINWTQVATAAVTAVFVTLVIEYLAKPRLEARKERILDRLRTRQEFMAAITNASLAAGIILLELPKSAEPVLRERFRAEQARNYKRLQTQIQDMFDKAGLYSRHYGGPAHKVALRYVMCLHGVVLSQRTQRRQAEIVQSLGVPVATVLDGVRWRPAAFLRALAEVERLIADTERTDDDALQGQGTGKSV